MNRKGLLFMSAAGTLLFIILNFDYEKRNMPGGIFNRQHIPAILDLIDTKSKRGFTADSEVFHHRRRVNQSVSV